MRLMTLRRPATGPVHVSVPLRHALAAFAVVLALALLPVLLIENPPLHDYPFHMARVYILAHWADSASLQAHYSLDSLLLPNVALDVVIVLLAKLMPLEWAGRAFLGLTLGLQLSGCMTLYRALHGRYSLWPLAAGLFLYNWIFLFAFLNYLFGVGLLLWATAIWIMLAQKPWWVRLACGSALTLALCLSHLIACGLFAVIVAGYELQRAVPALRRGALRACVDLAVGAAIFVPAAAVFIASSTAGEASRTTSHSLVNLLRTPPIFVRALMSGDYPIDLVSSLAALTCLLVIALRGRFNLARPMVLALILLGFSFLVMPHELFGGWGADTRIPLVLVLVLVASVSPTIPDRRSARLVLGLLLGTLGVQSVTRLAEWRGYDAMIRENRDAFKLLPRNAVLLVTSTTTVPSFQDIDLWRWQPPLPHVVGLAVLEGRDIFVPDTFAQHGQQPITVTRPYQAIYAYQKNMPIQVATTADLSGFIDHAEALLDAAGEHGPVFVLMLYPKRLAVPLPPQAVPVATTSSSVLLAIQHLQGKAIAKF